ncbi:MAG: SgcJ/EcaC family oxidoreductase [Planctomycetaceae bacterium]
MKQASYLSVCTVLALCGLCHPAVSAQDGKPVDPRINQIVRSIHSFAAAFNAGEAKKLSAHFAADGEYIDDTGTLFKGRENIEAEFAAFFKAVPGSQLAIDVRDIRFIGDSMAIEEGTVSVTQAQNGPVTVSRYIVVYALNGNRWQIASARDLDSKPAGHHDRLKTLEWLIGDWIDESDESTVETSIRWSADGHYLMTQFHIKMAGARIMSGTQRIGWDPQKQQIRSWTFDSEGGFGSGLWTGTEAGWIVKSDFVLPDGSSGSATSTYARQSPDAFRLTLSQRLVSGRPLPNLSVDVVRRPPQIKR